MFGASSKALPAFGFTAMFGALAFSCSSHAQGETGSYSVDTVYSWNHKNLVDAEADSSGLPWQLLVNAFDFCPKFAVVRGGSFLIYTNFIQSMHEISPNGKLVNKYHVGPLQTFAVVGKLLYTYLKGKICVYDLRSKKRLEEITLQFLDSTTIEPYLAKGRFVDDWLVIGRNDSRDGVRFAFRAVDRTTVEYRNGVLRYLTRQTGSPPPTVEWDLGTGGQSIGESIDYAITGEVGSGSDSGSACDYVLYSKSSKKRTSLSDLCRYSVCWTENETFEFGARGQLFFLCREPGDKMVSICRVRFDPF